MKNQNLANWAKRMVALLMIALPLQMIAQTSVIKMTTDKIKGDFIDLMMEFTDKVTIKSGEESKTWNADMSGREIVYQLEGQDIVIEGNVTRLSCSVNQLTKLDVSNCAGLTSLYCNNNQLTQLDVHNCTELTELNCNENQLDKLDVSSCTKLVYLECAANRLSLLDVSQCTGLVRLMCCGNEKLDISHMLSNLPSRSNELENGQLYTYSHQMAVYGTHKNFPFTSVQMLQAWNKGWVSKGDFDEMEVKNYSGIYTLAKEYTTLCSPCEIDFEGVQGIEAYVVSSYNDQSRKVMLKRVTQVPANTGVIIKGTKGAGCLLQGLLMPQDVPVVGTNLLKGVTANTDLNPIEGENTNFVLKDGKFVKVAAAEGESKKLAAGKAYLQLPNMKISGAKEIIIGIEDGTTAISDPVGENTINQGNGAWYTLDGQKVSRPATKGVYVRNGKKVMF